MKLLLIDGNSILNRAFYGIKTLTTKDGHYTNAIYGFMNILLRQLEVNKPELVGVTFDLPGGTFRNQMYSGYKANRKGMPAELAEQLPVMKELLGLLGYTVVTCPGFEADDILGTLSRKASEEGIECLILSGDRDSLQLVGNGTAVLYPSVRMGRSEITLMDEAAVKDKYGVTPTEFIDVKALMGDSSDNVPGVSGCGEKTATSLIAAFGSLDGVYDNIDSPMIKPAMRNHLLEDKEVAYLSKKLVTIDRHAPVDEDLNRFKPNDPDCDAVIEILNRLEMHSIVEKLGFETRNVKQTLTSDAKETVSGEIIPFEHIFNENRIGLFGELGEWYAVADGGYCKIDEDQLISLLKAKKEIFTGFGKTLHHLAVKAGISDFTIAFDYEIAGYLLNPSGNNYALKTLCAEYSVTPDFLSEPSELGFLFPLCFSLQEKLEQNGMTVLFREIELPLSGVLASMEEEGFLVDREGIREFGKQLQVMSESCKAMVYEIAGHEFNLNSPKQLGVVLFEELNLPHGKKTKTGYSTDAETLEKLRYDYPIVEYILQYRSYQKLFATYVEGLLEAAGDTGRIHTEFRQTETRTGRISSVNPNLQNIPIRTELGSQMRKFFVAKEGSILLDADYSQIELRVLSSISSDANMIQAFLGGHDVHTETASEIFGLPRDMINSELRRRAKAVNFGIVYGIGAYSLSQDIHVSVKEAQDYIDRYMMSFPNVSAYLEKTVEEAKKNGYVTTAYGRRRYIPELSNSNKQIQALGRRLAMNTPVQGTAADIIKIAMIRVFNRLSDECPQAKLILQVHDELIVEVPEKYADQASEILQQEMEAAADLKAPLIAEVHRGKTWYEAK
ncbi:MAG: DNA polymerase I [Oscillospiraceae bacterium]|nr:DNA polymerase I [Oscillospiraceae bacterium]